MLRLSMPVIGVADMRRAIGFWSSALRYTVTDGGPGSSWTELGPAGGGAPGDCADGSAAGGLASGPGTSGSTLALQVSESPLQDHPRIHLDLSVADAAEQRAEVSRLVTLGAVVVDWDMYPDDPDFIVLADTEGNKFCIVAASTDSPEP